eukprot:jgi/Ulvmu1/11540/UM078_0030.1
MAHAGQTTQLARRLRQICSKIRDEEFSTPGQICFFNRFPELKELRDKCLEDAKDVLGALQVQQSGRSASTSVEDVVQDIKEYVTGVTEHIDLALDRHRDSRLPRGTDVQVNKTAAVTRNVPRNHEPAPVAKATKHRRPQDSFDPPVDVSNTPYTPDWSHLQEIATDLPSPPDVQAQLRSESAAEPTATQPADGTKQQPGGEQVWPTRRLHRLRHPFASALETLPGKYPPWMLERPTPTPALPFDSSTFTYVDSTAALAEMADNLSSVREFAVDLEHSDRSFLGFTCLMQVSTRARDYVVDTLALRSHIGAALAAPFADVQVLKVLHGADRDIEWLQKDFGLFVVNMLDTGQAAAVVGLPRGLAKLLHHFCQVTTNKKLQMADWRRRPLPDAMLRYARMDTHYLLYIADMLRLKLLSRAEHEPSPRVPLPVPGPKGALGECLERSRQLTLKLYDRPLLTPDSFRLFYRRYGTRLNQMQLSALSALFAWRDRTARALDESPGRLMPNRMLVTLSQRVPQTPAEVLRAVGRHKMLIQYSHEVAEAVAEGLKHPISEGSSEEGQEAKGSGAVWGTDGAGSSGSDASASLGVQDASDDSSADRMDAEEALVAASDRMDADTMAERPVAATAAGASDVTAPGTAAAGAGEATGSKRRKNRKRSGSARDDAANGALEDAAGQAFEAVSFAALPSKRVKIATTGSMPGGLVAGQSGQPGRSAVLRSGEETGGQTQPAGAAVPAALRGAAAATMSAMFDTPIQRRAVTVRRAAGAGAGSLGGLFGAVAAGPVTTVPSRAEDIAADDTAGAGDSGQGGEGVRDKRAEVAAAAAALREGAEEAQGADVEAGGAGEAGAEISEEGKLLSVRERYGRKRKDGASLLGDVTTMMLSKSRGKAKMLRLRNQGGHDDVAGAPGADAGADAEMFDYEAVLDGSDRLPRREGRGGRGRGERGGRGRGDRGRGGRGGRGGPGGRRQVRGDEHKSSKRAGIFEGRKGGGWNPYAIQAEISAGKRSGGSAPKSANKSSNFSS